MIGNQVVKDLGIMIPDGWVVHHLDEDPSHNEVSNLILMSNPSHSKLHCLLRKQWSRELENSRSIPENCWKVLRDQITTAYLETENATVIRISDIGQPAAEPLKKRFQGEGSETMHGIPNLPEMEKGEDIVQTTTAKTGL